MSKQTRTRDSPPTRLLHEIEGNGVTVKMSELGRTGIQVSPSCLGTMMFGQGGNTDRDDCVRIIHRALDSGINLSNTPPAIKRASLRRRSADGRVAA